MLINLRNAMMAGKRLPYDAEVEYLESTGTQYIDLGFSLTPSSDLYTTVMLRGVVDNAVIVGQSNQFNWNANNPAYAIANSSAGKIFFAYGPTNNLYISDIGAGTLTDISYVGTTYTINGTTTTIPRVSSWSAAQGNAHVFCRGYANGTISPISKARVYSIKFVDNGATTHDLIPVRKGTVGYLYDRVSGKLFGNAGTGDFVLGPDVVPVEYIESHGTEWIDTGFNITNATSFSYDAKFSLASTIANSEPRLFSNEGAGSGAYYDIYFVTSMNILSIRQSGTTAQISRRDVPIVSTMDEQGNYRGYYEDEPQSLLYNATRAFVAPTTDRDYRIFSRGNSTSSRFLWQGKLYWLDFTKNGEPSRRYRPVRMGTEGAMMDVLTRRIYRNAGTGAFGYGNDLKYPIPAE